MVERFYDLMDVLPEAHDIRRLHPTDLHGSREKLLPFRIGNCERDPWLHCMNRALDQLAVQEPLRSQLRQAFHQTADPMRNRPEDQDVHVA